ncbi:MAG TPA: ABC transporter ATP-binding protein, partial [Blastocatellia bacterium]|nr:ABC transporter ATP-binding protein [Blastocatellia bacterium]
MADAGFPIVEFRDVDYDFGGRRILEGVNFLLAAGELLILLGESGCGKTTTLKLINRLIKPSGGEILIEGIPAAEWDEIRLRRRIGYVIQDGGLFPHYTAAENIGLIPRLEKWDT